MPARWSARTWISLTRLGAVNGIRIGRRGVAALAAVALLVFAAVALAVAPAPGTYNGKTRKQHRHVQVKVDDTGRVTFFERDSRELLLVLGIEGEASRQSIVSAYRKLAAQHHPDRFHGQPAASQTEAAAQSARDVIFAAAFPRREFARGANAAFAGVESQHDFAEREQIVFTGAGRFDLKRCHCPLWI